ncbi:hypothetical protein ACLI4Z_10795 [Natrialbaceae archaeon A-arb3/5]
MGSYRLDRRTVVTAMGATVIGAAIAGCLDRGDESDGGGDESSEDGGESSGDGDDVDEPIVDEAEATAAAGDTDPAAWADVERLHLDGHVGGWVGVEPPLIDRIENPTLVLVSGREYELSWTNRDGAKHNFALWNDEDERVGEYATTVSEELGATETLEFVANPELETYICEHQPVIQRGGIDVVDDDSLQR